jgi:hypothetical protein
VADEYRDPLRDEADPAVAPDPRCDAFDVASAFERIPAQGVPHTCAVPATIFTGARAERYREVSNPGLNRSDNHLQGVQRLGDHIYLSAGDLMEGCAQLFIARLRGGDGAAARTELTRVICLDERRDHGGGIQRAGNVLAVAIEGRSIGSTVVFLQLDDPGRPVWIPGARIDRTESKASAAGLSVVRLAAGPRVLVAVPWIQPARLFGLLSGTRAYLDMYLSRGADLRDGFLPGMVRLDASKLVARPPAWQAVGLYPSIHDGECMLIGTRSTAPAPGGACEADLCRLRFAMDMADTWPNVTLALEHVRTRRFTFEPGFGDFAAGAGFDCVPGGGLALLATSHFRDPSGFRLSICEAPAAPPIA